MSRLFLKITHSYLFRYGIENCIGNDPTSVHPYSCIRRLRLMDARHMLIDYDYGHPYHYESDVRRANRIAQQACFLSDYFSVGRDGDDPGDLFAHRRAILRCASRSLGGRTAGS